jgi:hypothetical protein
VSSSAADCTSAKTLCEAASSCPFKCALQLHAQATEVAQLTRLPSSCRSSYNTKLHLPSSKADSFAHLDCDWKRGGITSPAPQCLVACSPSHVGSTEVFRARFINAEPDIEAHQRRPPVLSPAPKRQRASYQLPRPQTGAAPRGTSTEPPESCRDFTDAAGRSSGPQTLEMGDLLMFDHRTYARGYTYCSSYVRQPGASLLSLLPVLTYVRAHQFTQNALLKRPQACTQVPLGWTRASEYPTLVAPWLHGEPHQSREECLAAFATGKPPQRWPHVYTGNVAQGAAMFRPALPALPAVPSTALARVLTGIDEFDAAPCATAWLLHELPGRGIDR